MSINKTFSFNDTLILKNNLIYFWAVQLWVIHTNQ